MCEKVALKSRLKDIKSESKTGFGQRVPRNKKSLETQFKALKLGCQGVILLPE
jgi:hypothetical protein